MNGKRGKPRPRNLANRIDREAPRVLPRTQAARGRVSATEPEPQNFAHRGVPGFLFCHDVRWIRTRIRFSGGMSEAAVAAAPVARMRRVRVEELPGADPDGAAKAADNFIVGPRS